jgi:hypothetical protein
MTAVDVERLALDGLGGEHVTAVEADDVGTRPVGHHHDVRHRALSRLEDGGQPGERPDGGRHGSDRLVEELQHGGTRRRLGEHHRDGLGMRELADLPVDLVETVGVQPAVELLAGVLPLEGEPRGGVLVLARGGERHGGEGAGLLHEPAQVGMGRLGHGIRFPERRGLQTGPRSERGRLIGPRRPGFPRRGPMGPAGWSLPPGTAPSGAAASEYRCGMAPRRRPEAETIAPHGDAPVPARALLAAGPEGYTAARDAAVKARRAAGDREGAAALKALRRPALALWAVLAAAEHEGARAGRRRDHEHPGRGAGVVGGP